MLTVIHTDDDRVLITDKHTEADLKKVIEEAKVDGVAMIEIEGDLKEMGYAKEYHESYIVVGTCVGFDIK